MKLSPTKKFLLATGLSLIAAAAALFIHDLATSSKMKHQQPPVSSLETGAPFSFDVVGDSAGGVITFRHIIDSINNDRPAFAVHLGDMAYEGRDYQYRAFIGQIKKLQVPLFTCPGNHDIMIGDEGRKNYERYFGPGDYSFTAGNSSFIFLDTSTENVTADQLQWLNHQLRAARSSSHRFVFTHVPLYDPRKSTPGAGHCLDDLNMARAMNEILDNNRVTMIFCGHIHAYYRGVWGKTPFIITGGGGQKLTGTGPDNNFNHYVRAAVEGPNVSYNVVKIPRTMPRSLENILNELDLLRQSAPLSILIFIPGIIISAAALVPKHASPSTPA